MPVKADRCRAMQAGMTDSVLDQLFLSARTHGAWLDRPVSDGTLERLYEAARMGPTSANSSPMRLVFVRSAEARELLKPALSSGNAVAGLVMYGSYLALFLEFFYSAYVKPRGDKSKAE